MKQDKLLCTIFTLIGVYLAGTAIFLFTLKINIALISAFGLIIFAFVFFYFAMKFYKSSKKRNTITKSESSYDGQDEFMNSSELNNQVEIIENNNDDEINTLEEDDKEEKTATIQEDNVDNETMKVKDKIGKELSELRNQQMLNRVKLLKIIFDENAQKTAMNKFFTIDIETDNDSIIEIGAVLFELGKPVKTFNSLINPIKTNHDQASKINYNETVKEISSEREVLEHLILFLNDAIKKQTFLCIYNAELVINLLEAAFRRNHIEVDMYYIDTLSIAKEQLKGLSDYKLNTLANHFNIINKNEYLASSNAEVCGNILVKILQKMYS